MQSSPDDRTTYPGGKSGAGIWQRLINMIPRHRILVSAFAGRCGVTRRIAPAEHTIVIDRDPEVCQWWDDWRRSPKGRRLEIHHCDSIEWLRHHAGLTRWKLAESTPPPRAASLDPRDVAGTEPSKPASLDPMATSFGELTLHEPPPATASQASGEDRLPVTHRHASQASEHFVFCDPPYVMATRLSGPLYACELSDDEHVRLLEVLTRLSAAEYSVMLCGYPSKLYASVDRDWHSIDHRVPTRRGLKAERVWMNYPEPEFLHDFRFVGRCRRSRERIRRRQRNWTTQLESMSAYERQAMVQAINERFA